MKDKSNNMLNNPNASYIIYNKETVAKYTANTRVRHMITGNEDIFTPLTAENLKQHILNFINSELADNLEDLPVLHNALPRIISISIFTENRKYTVLNIHKDDLQK